MFLNGILWSYSASCGPLASCGPIEVSFGDFRVFFTVSCGHFLCLVVLFSALWSF